ncbi:adenylate/guanylate cyclase domain-containing protein [Maribacter sp. BPC-D8]|uniref:adenylate/guanylate cyclase domain-containing protein n=1 Tax=Maribacter sp. BPC-D8 TaxID=3053613 RepID=UPI002B48F800|nr:adenylate/guanylate cyclase domain-containing protein [Maribacter sp. BPC-D8]WRI30997.1 adenylate/guanylate cyclase domain-containing protein [Maribacter sp. BPC-D8]
MKKKEIIRILTLALMWFIAIIAFDIVINAKVFDKGDWLPYFQYTFTSVLPILIFYCLVISLSEGFFMNTLLRDYPFAIVVFTKAVLQFAVIYVIHLVGAYVITEFMPLSTNAAVNAHYAYLSASLNIFYVVYFFIVSFHFSLYAQVSRKLGSTNLYDIVMGTYFRPKEAQRIFMFLDLNQSTTIAEEIGHLKYSRLIQECFTKLTHHIDNYDAEVYQYVGDEAVLTWKNSDSSAAGKCIDLYLDFRNSLTKDAPQFERKYGIAPKFKVGISFGTVAIAEVGDYKRDIAFHGTVLNTGARLCQLCKEIKEDILFSTSFFDLLKTNKHQLTYVGDYMLTGRKSNEKVFRLL